jgi:hypothetical protein
MRVVKSIILIPLSLQTYKAKNIHSSGYRRELLINMQTTMSRTSKTPIIEHYISVKISESQYAVLEAITQVKAMSMDDYCRWALRQSLERDIELHFGDGTKNRLLQKLQGE